MDCFASYYNKKACTFFSRFWNSSCCGVDLFTESLDGQNCLVVPLVALVRAIHYLHISRAIAPIFVPF